MFPEPHRILRRGGCGLVDLLGAQALQLLNGLGAAGLHHELVVHVVHQVGLLLAGLVQFDHGMAHRWPYLPFLGDHPVGFPLSSKRRLSISMMLHCFGAVSPKVIRSSSTNSFLVARGMGSCSLTRWGSRLACAGELQEEVVLALYTDCCLRFFQHVHGNPGKVFHHHTTT